MLLTVFLMFFFCVFVLRSFLLWKQTGVNPITFTKKDNAHDFNGRVFAMVSLIEIVIITIYTFSKQWYSYTLPIWYLEHEILQNIGWALLMISFILIVAAQAQMSASWRIGIDEKNKTKLVVKGLFSISRNPIFLGMLLANVGLFLVIPNAITLLILILSVVSVNTQVRLEEDFLKKEFKSAYDDYLQKVRRWM